MSPLVDQNGRVGGRFNLIDALVIAFIVLLVVPVAYSSWLLFRPARPQIHSVERSEITWAEERIAAGQPIRLKVKIRGSGLTPILRAYIGDVPAMGFTFEQPTSGDVIIGEDVPPGTHDLVLYDGTTEVARVRDAITIAPEPGPAIRVIGAFTLLDDAAAKALHVGQSFVISGRTVAEILALGENAPDRRRIQQGPGAIETESPSSLSRDAIVRFTCDPSLDHDACRIAGIAVKLEANTIISVPGSATALRLRIDGVVPDQEPAIARLRLRVPGSTLASREIRVGDRDSRWPTVDPRAAVVETAPVKTGADAEFTVRLGVDPVRHGWHYHNHSVNAGEAFSFVTDRYSVLATITELVVDER